MRSWFRPDEPFRDDLYFKRMYWKILLTDEFRTLQNGTILFFYCAKDSYMLLGNWNKFRGTENFFKVLKLFNVKCVEKMQSFVKWQNPFCCTEYFITFVISLYTVIFCGNIINGKTLKFLKFCCDLTLKVSVRFCYL